MLSFFKKWKRRNQFRSKFFEDMGLCISSELGHGYPMTYGMNHGRLRWAPGWFKSSVCHAWNKVNCGLNGHDLTGVQAFKVHAWPGAPKCCHCGALLMVDGRLPTQEEVDENDSLCFEQWRNETPPLDALATLLDG
jgi:hypothetical protein